MGLTLIESLNCKNDSEYYVFKKCGGELVGNYIDTLKENKEKSVKDFMAMYEKDDIVIDTLSNALVQIDLQQLAFLYKNAKENSVYFLRKIDSKSLERFKFDNADDYNFKFMSSIYLFMDKEKYHAKFRK